MFNFCRFLLFSGLVLVFLCSCTPSPKASAEKSPAPAKVSGPELKESELTTITLTAEAESRLGIRTAPIISGGPANVRRFTAEVLLPPGKILTVAAPVSGTLRPSSIPLVPGTAVKQGQILFELTPLLALPRDLRVTAEADVEQARTRVETAKLRKARADKMLLDQVGTVRAQEDATNELALAQSTLDAAQARLSQIVKAPLEGDVVVSVRAPRDGMIRQIFSAPGQPVSGGTPLVEVADLQTLWLRMAVYSGEASFIPAGAAVQVETLSGQALGPSRPVAAPPTGDPLATTVDFYYEAPRTNTPLKPGERLLLVVPSRTSKNSSAASSHSTSSSDSQRGQIAWSAIVYDIHGGTWLYEQAINRRYIRHRVLLDTSSGGTAYLASHPPAGTRIVIAGAAELWGVEFGAGK